jgi:uncharacterized protein HemX
MIGRLLLGWVLKNWLWGVLVAGVLALAGGIYATGYNAAWRQAQVDTLKATIASQQRDIDASRILRQRDQNVIAAQEAQALADEVQNEALRKSLAERPADAGRGLTQSELDLLLGKRR